MNEEDRRTLVARFKELTEQVLPARARQFGWELRLDHCFKRVCLDHAFCGVWYDHLARPAERHLEGQALHRAVAQAEELAAGDSRLLHARNQASLAWRAKARNITGQGVLESYRSEKEYDGHQRSKRSRTWRKGRATNPRAQSGE